LILLEHTTPKESKDWGTGIADIGGRPGGVLGLTNRLLEDDATIPAPDVSESRFLLLWLLVGAPNTLPAPAAAAAAADDDDDDADDDADDATAAVPVPVAVAGFE